MFGNFEMPVYTLVYVDYIKARKQDYVIDTGEGVSKLIGKLLKGKFKDRMCNNNLSA